MNTIELKDICGLSEREASLRIKQEGYNELPSQKNGSFIESVGKNC